MKSIMDMFLVIGAKNSSLQKVGKRKSIKSAVFLAMLANKKRVVETETPIDTFLYEQHSNNVTLAWFLRYQTIR